MPAVAVPPVTMPLAVAAGQTVGRAADPNLLCREKLANMLNRRPAGRGVSQVDLRARERRADLVNRVLMADMLHGCAVGRMVSEVHVSLLGVQRAKGEQTAGNRVVDVRAEMVRERVVPRARGVQFSGSKRHQRNGRGRGSQ